MTCICKSIYLRFYWKKNKEKEAGEGPRVTREEGTDERVFTT